MSVCCPEAEGWHLESCRAISLLSWALCSWLCWLSTQWKLLPKAKHCSRLTEVPWCDGRSLNVDNTGRAASWPTAQTQGQFLPRLGELLSSLPQHCVLCVFPKEGCGCSFPLPKPLFNGMFAYPSHLEGLNMLQGTWALKCLLQSALSVAVYGARVTQLLHHHLPPTSWLVKCREHLNWKWELGPMAWPEWAAWAWIPTRRWSSTSPQKQKSHPHYVCAAARGKVGKHLPPWLPVFPGFIMRRRAETRSLNGVEL